ncbi:MAG: hypothetical protein Q8N88_01775, partial [Nanoarchaeota archaeon]|nr:hypothetical protein [Nanoarchaeota archaeon]
MEVSEDDLSGAIKNGIERGESITSIRNSLVNAGYDRDKVEFAIQKNFGGESGGKSEPPTERNPETTSDNPTANNVPQ